MRRARAARNLLKVVAITASVLAALFVLALVALPLLLMDVNSLEKGQMTQTLSNFRQLQLATEIMQADGIATKDSALAWPGDAGASFSAWIQNLVPSYLSTNDAAKLLSVPVRQLPRDRLPAREDSLVLLYAVSSNSPPNTVFLSTANFTNTPTGGLPLGKDTKPYGDKGFVVMSKDGSGRILRAKNVGNTNLIGGFAPLCH